MLNTTQVKQLVKQRFGNYAKCYVNKCKHNNKRNLAFVMQTNLTDAELKALATEVGCTSVKQTKTQYDTHGVACRKRGSCRLLPTNELASSTL